MFGLLIAVLVVSGLGAVAIYSGAIPAPFDRGFSTPDVGDEFAGTKVPCLPEGTMPVPYTSVSVRVLNASGRQGLAGAITEELDQRDFKVTAPANTTRDERTQIRFGALGMPAAYTLAAHFESPVLLLDDRADGNVDLFIGEDFENLVDDELVGIDPLAPLPNPEGCVPIDQVTPLKGPTPAPTEVATEAPAEG